jgi:phage repressor protein C with HTH and peptisase S24 domain
MPHNHFDRFMQRLQQAAGVSSQSELANLLKLNRSAISRAKKRGTIPQAWLTKLSQSLGLDPAWLREGVERDEEFLPVPRVRAKLDAGGGSYVVDSQVEEEIAFRHSWLRRKGTPREMVIMEITGDSMEPLIREGDTVLVDQAQKEIYAGGIYAVGVQDTIMVKRLERQPHGLVLVSANPNYSPVHLQGDEIETVRIIGRVIGMWRDFF